MLTAYEELPAFVPNLMLCERLPVPSEYAGRVVRLRQVRACMLTTCARFAQSYGGFMNLRMRVAQLLALRCTPSLLAVGLIRRPQTALHARKGGAGQGRVG